MHAVVRRLPRPQVADPERATDEALATLGLEARVRGRRIAVTAGIRDIVAVLRGAVAHLRRYGAEPIIVAAIASSPTPRSQSHSAAG